MIDNADFRKKISSFLKISPEKVKDEAVLTDLVSDSFALIDLVVDLQEDYGARLTQDDLKEVRSVGELYNKLEQQLQNKTTTQRNQN